MGAYGPKWVLGTAGDREIVVEEEKCVSGVEQVGAKSFDDDGVSKMDDSMSRLQNNLRDLDFRGKVFMKTTLMNDMLIDVKQKKVENRSESF